MHDGLTDRARSMIRQAFSDFPTLESVVLYGSRALGTFRPGSDIDLAIDGADLTNEDLARLAGRLDELSLPYRYDLTIRKTISNVALREHIDRHGVLFWQRNMPPIVDQVGP